MISATRTNMVMRWRLNHRRPLPCRLFGQDRPLEGCGKKNRINNIVDTCVPRDCDGKVVAPLRSPEIRVDKSDHIASCRILRKAIESYTKRKES